MNFQNSVISAELLSRVLDSIPSRLHGLHGMSHWLRVEKNGLLLAEAEGADPTVVSLFALFHDCRRINDDADPGHGERGGNLARAFYAEGLLPIEPSQLDILVYACNGHTDETFSDNITIGCCWDADRLDLTRIGAVPDPCLLNTETAKLMARGTHA